MTRTSQIRARVEAASPAPWIRDGWNFQEDHSADRFTCKLPLNVGKTDRWIDAEFCAHARQDIPFLLGLVDELATALGNIRDGGFPKDEVVSSFDRLLAMYKLAKEALAQLKE